MTRGALLPLSLVAALLAGAGVLAALNPGTGASAAASRRGTVAGVVVRSAACPIIRAERPCPTYPVSGVRVSLWRNGRQVATTRTDALGQFRLAGHTGAAVLRGRTAFGAYVARASRDVTLRRGTTTHVRLMLDNRIR